MKLAVTIAALLSVLSAAPAHAYCTLNLRFENGALHWDKIDGATDYWIVEAYGEPVVYRQYSSRTNSFKVSHRSSAGTTIHYSLTATIGKGVRGFDDDPVPVDTNDACAGSIDVQVPADPAFRALTRRAVLPVVGSTPGANGGKFKTSLVLRPIAPDQRGKLIFHPAGQPASDSDPSIRYGFPDGIQPIAFDDVVAAIGQSGIGSLDIVPDEDASSVVPLIEARLFNDTSTGTFGTFAPPAYPFDYLRTPVMEIVVPESDRSRINVGFRTLTDTSMRVLIYNTAGILIAFRDATFPAGWMQMTSINDFAGRVLGPGQSLQATFTGSVIPFYTVTENSTNDPTLIVVSPRSSTKNVGAYVD